MRDLEGAGPSKAQVRIRAVMQLGTDPRSNMYVAVPLTRNDSVYRRRDEPFYPIPLYLLHTRNHRDRFQKPCRGNKLRIATSLRSFCTAGKSEKITNGVSSTIGRDTKAPADLYCFGNDYQLGAPKAVHVLTVHVTLSQYKEAELLRRLLLNHLSEVKWRISCQRIGRPW